MGHCSGASRLAIRKKGTYACHQAVPGSGAKIDFSSVILLHSNCLCKP